MDHKTEDVNYAIHEINRMLIDMFGIPKQAQGKKNAFKGYFPIIFKWINKGNFSIGYIYFVVSGLHRRYEKKQRPMSYAYVNGCLGSINFAEKYNPDIHKLPAGGDREGLLKAGYTINNLPVHLLTAEERRQRVEKEGGNAVATEEERAGLTEFLEKIHAGN